ncbi:MAG: hypothetical protein IJS96_08150, partial [Schwartzia sp.]|nr:hypothetical protein [Schwartzia sp. (in: firmicutes)]
GLLPARKLATSLSGRQAEPAFSVEMKPNGLRNSKVRGLLPARKLATSLSGRLAEPTLTVYAKPKGFRKVEKGGEKSPYGFPLPKTLPILAKPLFGY